MLSRIHRPQKTKLSSWPRTRCQPLFSWSSICGIKSEMFCPARSRRSRWIDSITARMTRVWGNLSTSSLCELRINVCPEVLSKIHVPRKASQDFRSYLETFQRGGPDESNEHCSSRLCASQHRFCLIVSISISKLF